MEKNKVRTYLGFCMRARKMVFGVDHVEKQQKGVFLAFADEKLGESSLKTMIKAARQLKCPLLITEEGLLGELLGRPMVKAAAVKESNLASAILSAVEGDAQFKLYSGGNN